MSATENKEFVSEYTDFTNFTIVNAEETERTGRLVLGNPSGVATRTQSE